VRQWYPDVKRHITEELLDATQRIPLDRTDLRLKYEGCMFSTALALYLSLGVVSDLEVLLLLYCTIEEQFDDYFYERSTVYHYNDRVVAHRSYSDGLVVYPYIENMCEVPVEEFKYRDDGPCYEYMPLLPLHTDRQSPIESDPPLRLRKLLLLSDDYYKQQRVWLAGYPHGYY
jgi:hypothetical protein